jgi:hypothetical protein
MTMIILLAVLTVVGGLAQYVASTPEHRMASVVMAMAAAAVAFAIVYRSRPGPRAVAAAVLILVNLVLALRALITPR